jgi:hypothetical protein
MKRTIPAAALFLLATALPYVGAQQSSPSAPYQGVSNPPSDDTIETTETPVAKPPASHRLDEQPAPRAESLPQPSTAPQYAEEKHPAASDEDMVQGGAQDRGLTPRGDGAGHSYSANGAVAGDPDGDIVHPRALRPGELEEGSIIHVRLLERLSSASNDKGQAFSTRVAYDVLQDGKVVIPAGAEIDGTIVESSAGGFGGHGTLRLRPETVILQDGSRFQLHAAVTRSTDSRARIGSEGEILPSSRVKRDGVEYGGAVGAGATTGALMAGPVGALTGGLIGAGVVTAHLLISHPQATLEPGTKLMFTLTERLSLVPAGNSGS